MTPKTPASTKNKLARQADGVVEIPVTIPQAKIKATYNQLVGKSSKTAEIPGFRKGKAPPEVVEKNLDKSKVYQQVLETLLPEIMAQNIKKHHLKPIVNPRLKPISMKENQDWQFTLEIVEFPQFELGSYQDQVRGALRATKIWVPGQKESAKPNPNQESATQADQQSLNDKRLKKVFDVLLANIEVPLAKILIEEEVNRALSRLLGQVQKLGLTIDQYVQSLGKTTKSLRQEYEKTAKANLKLEFILQKIGEAMKITVSEKDIEAMINAIPDEKTKKSYQNPQQRGYVKSVLRKRQTIDSLLKLA